MKKLLLIGLFVLLLAGGANYPFAGTSPDTSLTPPLSLP